MYRLFRTYETYEQNGQMSPAGIDEEYGAVGSAWLRCMAQPRAGPGITGDR